MIALMIVIIDNYDSFVHNLARHIELAGYSYEIIRNDAGSVEEIAARAPEAIIISPGPCTPAKAGICIPLIKALTTTTPILGVCLGHQALSEAFGGQTVRSPSPTHGKSCEIEHNAKGLFHGLPLPLKVGRYHSLITQLEKNSALTVTARNREGIIMAMEHQIYPAYGVQFHPESILTEGGLKLLKNFLTLAKKWNKENTYAH